MLGIRYVIVLGIILLDNRIDWEIVITPSDRVNISSTVNGTGYMVRWPPMSRSSRILMIRHLLIFAWRHDSRHKDVI